MPVRAFDPPPRPPTVAQEEVTLTDPFDCGPPTPEPNCDVCGALARQLALAEDPRRPEFDQSKASDLRVELARHQSRELTS